MAIDKQLDNESQSNQTILNQITVFNHLCYEQRQSSDECYFWKTF